MSSEHRSVGEEGEGPELLMERQTGDEYFARTTSGVKRGRERTETLVYIHRKTCRQPHKKKKKFLPLKRRLLTPREREEWGEQNTEKEDRVCVRR